MKMFSRKFSHRLQVRLVLNFLLLPAVLLLEASARDLASADDVNSGLQNATVPRCSFIFAILDALTKDTNVLMTFSTESNCSNFKCVIRD